MAVALEILICILAIIAGAILMGLICVAAWAIHWAVSLRGIELDDDSANEIPDRQRRTFSNEFHAGAYPLGGQRDHA